MDLNEQQYERMARWLDAQEVSPEGQEVSLDAQELSLARHIGRQEATLGSLLDVRVPPAALAAARQALRRRRGRGQRVLRIIAGVSAAAAAVLIGALLWPEQAPALSSKKVPTTVLFEEPYRSESHLELEAIAEQVSQVEAQMLASLPPGPEEGVVRDPSDEEGFDDQGLNKPFDEPSG